MVIKVVAGEQVVCDCTDGCAGELVDTLLVRINVTPCQVTVTVHCTECDSSMNFKIRSYLFTASQLDE